MILFACIPRGSCWRVSVLLITSLLYGCTMIPSNTISTVRGSSESKAAEVALTKTTPDGERSLKIDSSWDNEPEIRLSIKEKSPGSGLDSAWHTEINQDQAELTGVWIQKSPQSMTKYALSLGTTKSKYGLPSGDVDKTSKHIGLYAGASLFPSNLNPNVLSHTSGEVWVHHTFSTEQPTANTYAVLNGNLYDVMLDQSEIGEGSTIGFNLRQSVKILDRAVVEPSLGVTYTEFRYPTLNNYRETNAFAGLDIQYLVDDSYLLTISTKTTAVDNEHLAKISNGNWSVAATQAGNGDTKYLLGYTWRPGVRDPLLRSLSINSQVASLDRPSVFPRHAQTKLVTQSELVARVSQAAISGVSIDANGDAIVSISGGTASRIIQITKDGAVINYGTSFSVSSSGLVIDLDNLSTGAGDYVAQVELSDGSQTLVTVEII